MYIVKVSIICHLTANRIECLECTSPLVSVEDMQASCLLNIIVFSSNVPLSFVYTTFVLDDYNSNLNQNFLVVLFSNVQVISVNSSF